MTRKRPRVLLIGALIGIVATAGTACIRDADPIDIDDQAVAVHAVLEVGADSVTVVISRPAPLSPGPGSFVQYVPVSDAQVRLLSDDVDSWLVETPDEPCVGARFTFGGTMEADQGAGCYRAILETPIRPGGAYRLEITLPNGETVTGETMTPEPVLLTAPQPLDRITVDCRDSDDCFSQFSEELNRPIPVARFPVTWETPESVERSELLLRPVVVHYEGREYPGHACGLGYSRDAFGTMDETDDWHILNIACTADDFPELARARFDSIRAELTVVGWNDAYSEYIVAISNGQAVREERASPGLTGAYGVFGAVSTSSRMVLLVRTPEPAH